MQHVSQWRHLLSPTPQLHKPRPKFWPALFSRQSPEFLWVRDDVILWLEDEWCFVYSPQEFIFSVSHWPPAKACSLTRAAQLDALCSDPLDRKGKAGGAPKWITRRRSEHTRVYWACLHVSMYTHKPLQFISGWAQLDGDCALLSFYVMLSKLQNLTVNIM